MNKFLTIILILLCSTCFSQNKVVFQLLTINKFDSLTQDYDTTNLIKPKTTIVLANPTSKILEIARLEGHVIGIQVEVLRSKLQNVEHLILGYIIYKKKIGAVTWETPEGSYYSEVYNQNGQLAISGELSIGSNLRFSSNSTEYSLLFHFKVN
jgi:hypothetical protein